MHVYILFVMDSSEVVENVEMPQNKTDEEFLIVSRQSRKRKQASSLMDTSDTEIKRPHLPPISGDKLKVYHVVIFTSLNVDDDSRF